MLLMAIATYIELISIKLIYEVKLFTAFIVFVTSSHCHDHECVKVQDVGKPQNKYSNTPDLRHRWDQAIIA